LREVVGDTPEGRTIYYNSHTGTATDSSGRKVDLDTGKPTSSKSASTPGPVIVPLPPPVMGPPAPEPTTAAAAVAGGWDGGGPGWDPTKAPGKGWEWRGKPGSAPGDKNGNWYKPKTGESLHPDLGHDTSEGIGPHYDYYPGRGEDPVRVNPNTGEPLKPGEIPQKPEEPKGGSASPPQPTHPDGWDGQSEDPMTPFMLIPGTGIFWPSSPVFSGVPIFAFW
jgi:hypothetical protein